MKRKAVLVCNNDASGATHDIDKWRKYLLSGGGGAWVDGEIERLVNPTLTHLTSTLERVKRENNDFVIVVFAGHGEWERTTLLEINPQGEEVSETAFNNLSTREIVCLDCCRGVNRLTESSVEAELRMFSANQMDSLRQAYDNRMMQAYPQQVNLYACKVGQCAYGDNNGGFYTNNLIEAAHDFLPNSDFQTINRAHNIAAPQTTIETRLRECALQEPEMAEGRCVTNRQLIIGVSTKMFRIMG